MVDLGAGTGIFTRVLTSLGHEVIAVEPDGEMRAKLAAASADVTTLAGSAEAIPLPDQSVDAVVAAQAYHWFAQDVAHPEIGRVLRRGGVFAPIWNLRDESVEWVAELSRVAALEDGTRTAHDHNPERDFGPLFGPADEAEFRHAAAHTAETLLALVQSGSRYLTADEATQRRITVSVRELTSSLPETFELPYVAVALRATRL